MYDYLKKGDIYIPEFQRSYVWNRIQASRLIESLIIQCPISVLYLNQDRDEKLSVIDGNQRLQSIKLYLSDEYPLRGLTTYPELEGFYFSELDPRISRHILNRTLRCVAVLKDTHPQIKFDVFERLNTGAVQVNPHELRHGIFHGDLIETLDELSKEPVWKDVSGIKNDKRMKGAELILRFIALREDLKQYKRPLSGFLNNFCEKNQNPGKQKLLSWKTSFLQTIKNVNILLGDFAFRIFDEKRKINKNISAALYDAQMIGISNIPGKLPKISQGSLKRKLMALYQEEEFRQSITSGTSTSRSVRYRISRFKDFLNSLES
ncbi:DUF262 domain-containing protein [Desulfobacterales bacterium HSG2]|nr:DUF262 domain-containing protein [Desulfobacterales bacterium HSG2]